MKSSLQLKQEREAVTTKRQSLSWTPNDLTESVFWISRMIFGNLKLNLFLTFSWTLTRNILLQVWDIQPEKISIAYLLFGKDSQTVISGA